MFPLIKKGSKDAVHVKKLKELLNYRFGSQLNVDNPNFLDQTEKEVKSFQKKHGLIQDGIVGDLTWKALNEGLTTSCPNNGVDPLIPAAIAIASTQVGVKELTGKNDGVEVESYLKSVGLGKGYAWCMAFVYWVFLKACDSLKIEMMLPKNAGVLNFFRQTKPLSEFWVLDLVKAYYFDLGLT